MNKAIKAQWGVVVPRVLPIIGQFIESLPSLAAAAGIAGSFVDAKVNDHSDSKKQLRQQVAQLAQQRRHQMAVAAARNFTAPTLNNTQSSDATRITRPVVVSTTRPTSLNLHRTATTKVHPIAITRTMSAAQDSTGTAPRDTTNTAPRDTTGTATPATIETDNRSLREKLGDRIAGRGRQKPKPKPQQNQNTENPEPFWKKHWKGLAAGGVAGAPWIYKGGKRVVNEWFNAWGDGNENPKDSTTVVKSVNTQPINNNQQQDTISVNDNDALLFQSAAEDDKLIR